MLRIWKEYGSHVFRMWEDSGKDMELTWETIWNTYRKWNKHEQSLPLDQATKHLKMPYDWVYKTPYEPIFLNPY